MLDKHCYRVQISAWGKARENAWNKAGEEVLEFVIISQMQGSGGEVGITDTELRAENYEGLSFRSPGI